MSTPKHTPEPWEALVSKAGFDALIVSVGEVGAAAAKIWSLDKDVVKANAARIVACVNALAGIEDPEAFVQQAKAAINKDKFPFT